MVARGRKLRQRLPKLSFEIDLCGEDLSLDLVLRDRINPLVGVETKAALLLIPPVREVVQRYRPESRHREDSLIRNVRSSFDAVRLKDRLASIADTTNTSVQNSARIQMGVKLEPMPIYFQMM